MEPLALGFQETRGAGRVVRRLDQFDLGVAHRKETDRDMVVFHVHDGLEVEPKLVAIETEGGLEVANDDGDVVDPANAMPSVGRLELIHSSLLAIEAPGTGQAFETGAASGRERPGQ